MLASSLNAIDTFVDALWLEDGLSRNTLAAYRRDLTLFAHWLAAREVPSLAAATSLQRLKLRCNPRLKLSHADVDGVLAHMACLVYLDVGTTQLDPAVLDHLRHTLPQLKVT